MNKLLGVIYVSEGIFLIAVSILFLLFSEKSSTKDLAYEYVSLRRKHPLAPFMFVSLGLALSYAGMKLWRYKKLLKTITILTLAAVAIVISLLFLSGAIGKYISVYEYSQLAK